MLLSGGRRGSLLVTLALGGARVAVHVGGVVCLVWREGFAVGSEGDMHHARTSARNFIKQKGSPELPSLMLCAVGTRKRRRRDASATQGLCVRNAWLAMYVSSLELKDAWAQIRFCLLESVGPIVLQAGSPQSCSF